MTRALSLVVRAGEVTDVLAAAVRATPRSTRRALSVRRFRRIAMAAALAYLPLYLVAVGDVVISGSGQFGQIATTPSVEFVPDWTDRIFAERAAFLYEPIATIYLIPELAFFLSVGNLAVGSVLAAMLGLTVSVPAYAASRQRSCSTRPYSGLAAALPGLLMGFACCAPTFLLLVGTGFAAAVLPVFIPLRSYLFPAALALMAAILVWGAQSAMLAEESKPT